MTRHKKPASNRLKRLAIRFRCAIEARIYRTGVTIRFVPHKSMAKYSPRERGTPSMVLFINTSAAAYTA